MDWSKSQWIQGKWLILLTESLLWVSGSWRVCLFPEPWAKAGPTQAVPLQAGCSPIAPEQSTGAESIDCPRQGKAVKHTQHLPENPVRSKRGQGQRQEWRQGYNMGPKSIQEGLPKTWWKGCCKVEPSRCQAVYNYIWCWSGTRGQGWSYSTVEAETKEGQSYRSWSPVQGVWAGGQARLARAVSVLKDGTAGPCVGQGTKWGV